MRIKENYWSLIIPGKWNKYILTPEWVGNNLFKEDDLNVEYPINNPDLPPRFISKDNIIFIPASHRVSFIFNDPMNDEILNKVTDMSRELIACLPHTPLSAFGINAGYEEDVDEFGHLEIFQQSDLDDYADISWKTSITEINRQFTMEDKAFNLSIANNNEIILFDFNFNYIVPSDKNFSDILTDSLFIECRQLSLDIMKTVYDLEVDDPDDD